MHIRRAGISDTEAIRDICLSAFDADERVVVAQLAVDLLSEVTIPPTIGLVAEAAGSVIGHVAFSPMTSDGDDTYGIYILAPLAVRPRQQKRGVGSGLVEAGMQQLSEKGLDLLLVYGDPAYYGRFGFTVAAAACCIPPYDIEYSYGWQGIALSERGAPVSPLQLECVAALRSPALW